MELTIESYGRINRLSHILAIYNQEQLDGRSPDILDYIRLYPELGLIGELDGSITHYRNEWIVTADEARGYLPVMDFVAWKLMEDAAILASMLSAIS